MKLHRPRFGTLALLAFGWAALAACKGQTTPEPPTGWEFSGRITLNGQPFAGVDVFLSGAESKKISTGADGRYVFGGLKNGEYILTPSRLLQAFSPSNYEVRQASANLNFTAVPATSFGTNEGQLAPNFSANNQSNNPTSLYEFHGRVILLDFTADWCTPCREKAETSEAFYQKYKDKGLTYILIVIEGNPALWASTYGLSFPVLDDNSHVIYNQFRKTSIPLPHILDRNGTIRYKREGWNKSEVEAMILRYL